jgi:HSP20 family protein
MLVHTHPFTEVFRLERELERVFGRAFGADPARAAQHAPLTMLPDADGVTLRAELPGVDPATIEIAVEDRVLTISAERPALRRENGQPRLQERRVGAFRQVLQLADDLDADAITAHAEHGVLTVRVPKRAEAKPRKVVVQVS